MRGHAPGASRRSLHDRTSRHRGVCGADHQPHPLVAHPCRGLAAIGSPRPLATDFVPAGSRPRVTDWPPVLRGRETAPCGRAPTTAWHRAAGRPAVPRHSVTQGERRLLASARGRSSLREPRRRGLDQKPTSTSPTSSRDTFMYQSGLARGCGRPRAGGRAWGASAGCDMDVPPNATTDIYVLFSRVARKRLYGRMARKMGWIRPFSVRLESGPELAIRQGERSQPGPAARVNGGSPRRIRAARTKE